MYWGGMGFFSSKNGEQKEEVSSSSLGSM